MKKLKIALGVVLLATAGSSLAAPSAIVYVNGISNTFDDSIASLQIFKSSMQTNRLDRNYVYGNAYNAAGGFFADLKQIFSQKHHETSSARDFWLYVDGGSAQPSWMTQAIVDNHVKRFVDEQKMTELPKHMEMYRKHLKDGRKVVMVAHSQGNLYANISQNLLVGSDAKAERNITTVGVASPARYLLPHSSYVTSSWDLIINALRIVKPVLPANIRIGFHPFTDVTGHSFGRTYMNRKYQTSRTILQEVSKRAS